jgi:hypothetical protein
VNEVKENLMFNIIIHQLNGAIKRDWKRAMKITTGIFYGDKKNVPCNLVMLWNMQYIGSEGTPA